jgi:hypothetical protein
MHLIGSTVLACLNLIGWAAVSAALLLRWEPFFGPDGQWATVVVLPLLAIWLAVCLVAVVFSVDRTARLLRCRRDPEYVANLALDLLAEKGTPRRRALQTLADYFGQPADLALCWPFEGSCQAWQCEAFRAAVREQLEVGATAAARPTEGQTESQPKQTPAADSGAALEPLRRGVAETAEMLADVIKDSMLDWTPDDEAGGPESEPLPTMETFRFVEALRAPAESALTSLADVINDAPDARTLRAVPDPCIEVLGDLLDEALKVGLKLRVEAALAGVPALQGPHLPRRWKKYRAVAPPEAGPTRDWVKKFRRMKADEGNALGT